MKKFLLLLSLANTIPILSISSKEIKLENANKQENINSTFVAMQQPTTKTDWSVAVTPNGNTYMSETIGQVYCALASSNSFTILMKNLPTGTYNLLSDAQSNIYAANRDSIYVALANSDTFNKLIDVPRVVKIFSFYLDPATNNIFISSFNNSIYYLASGGTEFQQLLSTDYPSTFHIQTFTTMLNGDIYAGDNAGNLFKLQKGAASFLDAGFSVPLSSIYSLDSDISSNLWITDGNANFLRVASNQTITKISGLPSTVKNAFPLVSDSKGNFYTGTSYLASNTLYVCMSGSTSFIPYSGSTFTTSGDIKNIVVAANDSLYINARTSIFNNNN